MNAPITNRFVRTAISLLFVIQIFIVIKLVLLKNPGDIKYHFEEDYNMVNLQTNFLEGNYIPFNTLKCYLKGESPMRYTKENLLGNILLFLPFGILLPLLFEKVNTFRKMLFWSFSISATLELIQLFAILGNFDVDDILLNMFGAALGFGVLILARELSGNARAHISE